MKEQAELAPSPNAIAPLAPLPHQTPPLDTHHESLLLKATLASSGSSPPSKNTKKLAVPRDGSSTLNYLYGNSAPSPTPIARPPPSPGVQGAKNARKHHGSQNKDPHGHLPAWCR